MQWKNTVTGEELYEEELEYMFRDFLDDAYGDIKVCGATFGAAYALRRLDRVAYRCNFLDWLDANDWEEV